MMSLLNMIKYLSIIEHSSWAPYSWQTINCLLRKDNSHLISQRVLLKSKPQWLETQYLLNQSDAAEPLSKRQSISQALANEEHPFSHGDDVLAALIARSGGKRQVCILCIVNCGHPIHTPNTPKTPLPNSVLWKSNTPSLQSHP